MQSLQRSDQFWTEIQETCEALSSDIYLPTDIEAHLQHARSERDRYQSYPSRLCAALDPIYRLFDLQNEANNADDAFLALDNHLQDIEENLHSIVASLEESSSSLRDSANSRENTKRHADHALEVAKHISDFVDALDLPDDIRNTLDSSNPHSIEFKNALAVLSRALTTCKLQRDANAVQQVLPWATSLHDIAIRRIEDRLQESFQLMRHPSSSFTILRDTLLLKQNHLIKFIKDHCRLSFDRMRRQYTEVAKLALGCQVRSYYAQLVSCGTSGMTSMTDPSSVSSSAATLLSSFWDYASQTSKSQEAHDELQTSEDLEGTQSLEKMKEGIPHLSNQCEETLRSALDPPLTSAELQLMRNSSVLSFSSIFRHLTSFFLKYEKSESRFLCELFSNDGYVCLEEIFSSKDNPVLECLERSIESLASTIELEQLCLSLYVCRRIRENVKTQREVDHRVAYCVIAERVMQTQFTSRLDSKAAKAREALLDEIHNGNIHVRSQGGATWFFTSVARLLEVVRQGDAWISSQDIGHKLRRRLSSCVVVIASSLDSTIGTNLIARERINSYLRFLTNFLSALDTSTSPKKKQRISTKDIRKPIEDSFRAVCDIYAKSFESSRLQEMGQLESTSAATTMNERWKYLTVLREKNNNIENLVREDIRCLMKGSIDGVYEDEAVRNVLNYLGRRTEAVRRTLSVYHPELSAMMNF